MLQKQTNTGIMFSMIESYAAVLIRVFVVGDAQAFLELFL